MRERYTPLSKDDAGRHFYLKPWSKPFRSKRSSPYGKNVPCPVEKDTDAQLKKERNGAA